MRVHKGIHFINTTYHIHTVIYIYTFEEVDVLGRSMVLHSHWVLNRVVLRQGVPGFAYVLCQVDMLKRCQGQARSLTMESWLRGRSHSILGC